MARREFEILDKKGRERSSIEKYEVLKGNLDGKPEMYEFVEQIEDNCGYLTVYRDNETTTAVSVVGEGSGKQTLISLVGDEDKFDETLKRIKSVVPDIFTFKRQNEEN